MFYLIIAEFITTRKKQWISFMINFTKITQIISLFCLLSLSSLWADFEPYEWQNDYEYCPSCFSCCGCDFPLAAEIAFDVDNWRSIPDGSWVDNFGILTSLNFGTPFPFLSCYNFGVQFGGSYGVYDWSGRGSSDNHIRNIQQQGFVTVGVFRRTPYCCGFNGAIAYDWMFNKNFGEYALNPILTQLRWEGSYLFPCSSEFGVWGTTETHTSHKHLDGAPISFQAISQVNLFWRQYFANCSQTMIWLGMPYKNGLIFRNRLPGRLIVGASFRVPLNRQWSIDGHAVYMQPRANSGVVGSRGSATNVCFGITYAFFCGISDQDIDYAPYLPVANNSVFLTDTSFNF